MIRPWWETEAGTAQKLFGDIPQVSQPGLFTDGQANTARRGAFQSLPQNPDTNKYIYQPYNGIIPQYDNPQTATTPFLPNAQQIAPIGPQQPIRTGGFGRLPPMQQPVKMSDWYRKHKGLPTSTPVKMSGWGVNGKHQFNLQPGQALSYRKGATINAKSMASRDLLGRVATSEAGYNPQARSNISGDRQSSTIFKIGQQSGRSYMNTKVGVKAAKTSKERLADANAAGKVKMTIADIRQKWKERGYTDEEIDAQLYGGVIS